MLDQSFGQLGLKKEENQFNFELNINQIFQEIDDKKSHFTRFYEIEVERLGEVKRCDNKNEITSDIENICDCKDTSIGNIPIKIVSEKGHEYKNSSERKSYNMIVDDTSQIEDQLITIFNSKKSKCTSLAGRRDVINKTILRGFKKFFVNLFESNSSHKNESSKQIKSLCRSTVLSKAKCLGLITLKSDLTLNDDFENLIYWMSTPKITKKVMNLSISKNSSIILLHDIILNYSHHKLNRVFNDKNIMNLFSYFIKFGKNNFMQGIEDFKQNQCTLVNNIVNIETVHEMEAYREAFEIFESHSSY